MDITLIIHGSLAESLLQLAAQRGLSVEALGQEVVAAGLSAVAPPAERDSEVLYLGTIALPPTAPMHPLRLRSPILARGPIPHYTIEILSALAADPSDAD